MRLPGQIEAVFIVATLSASVSAQTPAPAAKPVDSLHAWVGLRAASDLEAWTQWHISEENRLIAALLAVKGTRTPDNTLELYDQVQFHLAIASNEVGLLFEVHPQPGIRDKAQ